MLTEKNKRASLKLRTICFHYLNLSSMLVMTLFRFLMIAIHNEHRGGRALADFIDDALKVAVNPLVSVGKDINIWWTYVTLSADEAKVCKNGETAYCIQERAILDDYKFHLYVSDGGDSKPPERLYLDKIDAIIKKTNFKPDRKLVLVILGFTSTHHKGWVQQSKDALLKQKTNVISVEYESHGDYILFANNNGLVPLAEAVGDKVGTLIKVLINKGWNSSRIHLIGHSLGSQVASFAAKYLKKVDVPVKRITGLDPVGRVFTELGPERRLNEKDAEFVDCIYTDFGGIIGAHFPVCGANYFISCHVNHPITEGVLGLPKSHFMVTRYFAESIYPSHVFEARKCDIIPCRQVDRNKCRRIPNKTIKMGYPASPKDLGLFYVEINKEYPYAQTTNQKSKKRRKKSKKNRKRRNHTKKRG